MAASVATAIKATLESAGLGVPVFVRRAPKAQAAPYIEVHPRISIVPEPVFNPLNDDGPHVSELVQVSVWQRLVDPPTTNVESLSLVDNTFKALHGKRLPGSPRFVFCMTVAGMSEREERKPTTYHNGDRLHTPLTVRLRRLM